MGINRVTTVVCACDLCGSECGPAETRFIVEVHPGDGRDVGPGYLHGELKVDLPYRVNNGIVCEACKVKWMRQYIADHDARAPAGRAMSPPPTWSW